jgi:DNA polymerase-4
MVEPLSLDEAYLDVTDNLRSIPTAWETAKEVRARIVQPDRERKSSGSETTFSEVPFRLRPA